MGHQQAVAIMFNPACLAVQTTGDQRHAKTLGHAGGDFAIMAMDLFLAPAVELDMGDDKIIAPIRKKRPRVPCPEVFGGNIPKGDVPAQEFAGLCVLCLIGQQDHRFKRRNGVGNVGDCPLQHVQKSTVGIYPAARRPHHEGLCVGVFFGWDIEISGGHGMRLWHRGQGGGPEQEIAPPYQNS